MAPLLARFAAADGLVLAAPMNVGSVTVVTKRFMEHMRPFQTTLPLFLVEHKAFRESRFLGSELIESEDTFAQHLLRLDQLKLEIEMKKIAAVIFAAAAMMSSAAASDVVYTWARAHGAFIKAGEQNLENLWRVNPGWPEWNVYRMLGRPDSVSTTRDSAGSWKTLSYGTAIISINPECLVDAIHD